MIFSKKKKREKTGGKRSLCLVSDPRMPFNYVEAYKSLRTNLKFIGSNDSGKSFVITSALPMESKSNVSINLAITLAADNKHVIIIDADLRKPAVHTMLKIKQHDVGLSSVLSGEVALNDAIIHMENDNIDVLPCGIIPPNPSELLSQDRMFKLIEVLKKHYDFVIVDAPPVSIVTDAAVIGNMVDGALLVVRSDYARVDAIQLAKKKLEDVNVKVFGVVLTRYNPKHSGKQSGYYYYKDYGYGYGYGYGEKKKTKTKTK